MKPKPGELSPCKMLVNDLIMGFLYFLLLCFSLWLVWITYFREYFEAEYPGGRNNELSESIDTSGIIVTDHFHGLDDVSVTAAESNSICAKCHAEYPHTNSRKIRAILNAHSYFMACETCHLESMKSRNITFRWIDDSKDGFVENNSVDSHAKISPAVLVAGSIRRLDNSLELKLVDNYLAKRYMLDKDQEDEAQARIHRSVSDEAVSCNTCHASRKKPYLPYSELGYSQQRISEISGTEAVKVINKYSKFYLPDLLDEGAR